MKKRINPNYQEGDIIAVPLNNSCFAIGVIARSDRRGRILCYFYGETYVTIPRCEQVVSRSHADAIWICRCGDLGIREGRWTVICRLPDWHKEDWPIPPFVLYSDDKLSGRKTYYDDHLSAIQREENLPSIDLVGLPEDGFFGYGAVEITLNKLLIR